MKHATGSGMNQTSMIDTWPNRLTFLRLAIVPAMILTYAIMSPPEVHWVLLLLFAVGSITDYLDGILARRLNQVTPIGRTFDPIADKLLVLITVLILLASGQAPFLPCAIIICREIFVSGLRESLLEQASGAVLHVTTLAKYKTTSQMVAIIVLLLAACAPDLTWLAWSGEILIWIAAALSAITGFDYAQKALKTLL